jgi:hypothetical protein
LHFRGHNPEKSFYLITLAEGVSNQLVNPKLKANKLSEVTP